MEKFNLKQAIANKIKEAGRKKIKDRGINWKEKYHEKSVGLKRSLIKKLDIKPT